MAAIETRGIDDEKAWKWPSGVPLSALRVLLVGVLVFHQPATTAVIVVDETCSLADAITSANTDVAVGGCAAGSGEDEIQLTQHVLLSQQLPTVARPLTLEGNNFSVVRDGAASNFGVFEFSGAQQVTLRNLTVGNGVASNPFASGGGIYTDDTDVTLDTVTLFGNWASAEGGAIFAIHSSGVSVHNSQILGNTAGLRGGGISGQSNRSVLLVDSTISENYSGFWGGGVYIGGSSLDVVNTTISDNLASFAGGGVAAHTGEDILLSNSTVSGNEAGGRGGGFYRSYFHTDARIESSTVVANTAPLGSGIYSYYAGYGILTLENSIVAGNPGGQNCVLNQGIDAGGNFDDDGSCGGAAPITPGVDFDTTLADNGGPTLTHALSPDSVAIDAAGACGSATDQRGFPRDDGACDSGAFEVHVAVSIGGTCPGPLDVTVTQAEPDRVVVLYAGSGGGTTDIPGGACAGTALDLSPARRWKKLTADANGTATHSFNASSAWCSRSVQALDGFCSKSNVADVP